MKKRILIELGETENIKEDHDDETLGKYDKEA